MAVSSVNPVLSFTKLTEKAVAPLPWPPGRFSNTARFSAYDIASDEDVVVKPNSTANLTTGLAITIPDGARLFTASRTGERLPDGVGPIPRAIDSWELRNVTIVFWNTSSESFHGIA